MNTKPEAIITIGCSGSGKSTFAKLLCEKNSDTWIEVNRDAIRFKDVEKNWNKYRFTRKNEKLVTIEWNKQLDDIIELNKNVILSDTNLNEHYRSDLINKLKNSGYHVTIKYFPVEFEELLKRDR